MAGFSCIPWHFNRRRGLFSVLAPLGLPAAIAAAVYATVAAADVDIYDVWLFAQLGPGGVVPLWLLATAEQALTWHAISYEMRIILSATFLLATVASFMLALVIQGFFGVNKNESLQVGRIAAISYLALAVIWLPAQLVITLKSLRELTPWLRGETEPEDRLEAGGGGGEVEAELRAEIKRLKRELAIAERELALERAEKAIPVAASVVDDDTAKLDP